MWFKSPGINVSIDIQGNVQNSEIVGVKIEGTDGKSRHITSQLFRYIFVEYLGLPSLSEIQTRLVINKAIRKGQYLEGVGVDFLWRQLTHHFRRNILDLDADDIYHHYAEYFSFIDSSEEDADVTRKIALFPSEGVVVQFHKVQLCPFVNRTPGFRYVYPRTSQHPPATRMMFADNPLSRHLIEDRLAGWEHAVVTQLGLGDIRFRSIDAKYLLNVVPTPSEYAISRYRLEPRIIMEEFFKPESFTSFSYDHTSFGFPLVVTSSVYESISGFLDEYGALYAEEVTGVLQNATPQMFLNWMAGIPKVAIYVENRSSIKGVRKPVPFAASAWSLVTNPQENHYLYAYWPFFVGLKNYQETIRYATGFIKQEMAKYGFEPIFEFDSAYNWFSNRTPFTPDNIVDLYKSIQAKDRLVLQEQKQELTRASQISTQGYLNSLQDSYPNPDVEEWTNKLYDADLLCNEALVEMRFNQPRLAQQKLMASISIPCHYTWSRFFNGISLYFSDEKSAALSWLHQAIEYAVDDLLQNNDQDNSRTYHGIADQYSAWYVMIWLWYDFVRHELKISPMDVGHFSPAPADPIQTHRPHLSEETLEPWRVYLGSLKKHQWSTLVSIDQVWNSWFGTTLILPFQKDLDWLFQHIQATSNDSTGQIPGNLEYTPDWPLLRTLANAIIDSPTGKLLLTYPRWSSPTLQKIHEGDADIALAYLTSSHWRERRVAQERAADIGDVAKLLTILELAEPAMQRSMTYILALIAYRRPVERPPITTALLKQLRSAQTDYILLETIHACAVTSDPSTIEPLIKLLMQEEYGGVRVEAISKALISLGKMSAAPLVDLLTDTTSKVYRVSNILEEIGSDAQPALIEGLSHPSPDVRETCAFTLARVGNEQCLPALKKLIKNDRSKTRYGKNVASMAQYAISRIQERIDRKE